MVHEKQSETAVQYRVLRWKEGDGSSQIGLLMAELNTIGNESAKEKLRMEGVLEATRKGAQERVEILEGK